ncbi:lectin-like domain-containing protein [Mangrovimonas xylaniphaga]|uniref:lectin-like domain-containing protein n=1 Tax=Mangrovimonas xylaniphaga TaxID=1645915 RepID=UPI0009E892AF|nr:gliding motility-associated C-terminal domain-containing protein [Mangrovimonas xylaniphaga]
MRKFIYLSIFLFFSLKISAQLVPSFHGSASSLGGECYRITNNTTTQRGAVWYNNVIDLTGDFEIIFDANFGDRDADGADGMAFVMKTTADVEYGTPGGGLGYEGLTGTLAVEFDTWRNGNRDDIDEDHLALMMNGDTYHTSSNNLIGPVVASATSGNIEDGMYHEVKISWNAATQTFRVFFDCEERITFEGDIVTQAFGGVSNVYFGYTGSTGASYNVQEICFKYVSFSNTWGLVDREICSGESIDNIDATYSGATAYAWSPAEGVSDVTIPNPVFTPTENTTYTLAITDNCGDTLSDSFDVVVLPLPTADLTVSGNIICDGNDAEFFITGVINNEVTYTLNGGVEQTVMLDDTGAATIVVPAPTTAQTLTLVSIDSPNPPVSGNGLSASGGVNPDNTVGAVETVGTLATNANSAYISTTGTTNELVMVLDDIVPEGSEIFISSAKRNGTAQMEVTDGVNSQIIDSGTVHELHLVSFITGKDTNTLTFVGVSGYYWIDGVEYTFIPPSCVGDLSASETISLLQLDSDIFLTDYVCDDESRDGVESFDLTYLESDILSNVDASMFAVSYHTSLDDANSGDASITFPYENVANPQTIYVRVESNFDTDCYYLAEIELKVEDVPYASFDTEETEYKFCAGDEEPVVMSLELDGFSESDVTIEWYSDDEGLISGESGLSLSTNRADTYTAVITSNQGLGCSYEVSTNVVAEVCKIPEGISPNGDLANDYFELSSFGVKKIEIFNRYGTLVYSKHNYTNEWRGQTNDGEDLPVGTYFYTMEFGEGETHCGWVYLNK